MSIRLRDLIKKVRQCKTAQEERDVISKEAAALRQAFKEQDGTYRHRNVAKLLYMHMLGYPTHFGQMETLKLIASAGFPEKRIGYLGLMILLDERQEVLMLVTNSLKNDLNSKNQYTAGLALCALGNICSSEMARDLAPEVERLLASSNPYLRKKAALCATRVLRKLPDMLESFAERAAALLQDRNQSVLLAGVTLIMDICQQEPAAVELFRPQVPTLCKALRSLTMAGFSPDYDVGGITDPFLQVQILKLLRVLGRGNAEASDAMSDVLAQVATNTEGARNAGNAILYECVQTIMAVESIGGLRVLAVNIMGRFLGNKDNNIRYVALNTLARVVGVDTQAVQRHRATIVECVKDADISIRRRALELVYALVNEGNIRTLTKELLDYLNVCDLEFKPDLANKICMLVQRYAPDKRWYIDSLTQVLVQAGGYVKPEACRALVVLIMNAAQLHGYAVRALYRALSANLASTEATLLTTATWCIGEYGELLTSGSKLLEGEAPLSVSEAEVLDLLEAVLRRPELSLEAREYALTAVMKLSARFPNSVARIKSLIDQQTTSAQLEVQNRSVEFSQLFRFETIRPQVMEHIPPLEESAYDASLEPAEPSGAAAEAQAPASNAAADLAALLGLDASVPSSSGAPAAAAAAAPPTSVSALQDLLAGDLLVNGTSAAAAAAAPVPTPAAADPLADIFGGGSSAVASTSAAGPSFTAYQKGGLTITFSPSKPAGKPECTDVLATYRNASAEPINDFTLQAAVPKFMQLRLDPASGSLLAPGGGSATQQLHITNSMHGTKPLVLRIRLTYTNAAGESIVEQAEVNQFPAGF